MRGSIVIDSSHIARVSRGSIPCPKLLVGVGASGAELEAAVRQLGDVGRMVSRQDAHAEADRGDPSTTPLDSIRPVYPSRDFPVRDRMSYRLVDEASWGRARRTPMAVETATARRRFTREEYHRMGEVGILKPTDRVELIRGEIVEMSPIGRRHYAFVNNLNQLLVVRLAGRAIVAVQGPIAFADDTEPEPDLAIIRRRPVPYKEREAFAEDALLLVEVAEISLAYDRSTKLRLYAAAGIPEYWVVNVVAESVEVYRTPDASGYRDVSRVAGVGTVALQAFPDVTLTLAEIFA
jgi:Uma2 family endonuclease